MHALDGAIFPWLRDTRAFFLLNHLETFSCMLLISNHIRALLARAIFSCFFILNCTRNQVITYTNTALTRAIFFITRREISCLHAVMLYHFTLYFCGLNVERVASKNFLWLFIIRSNQYPLRNNDFIIPRVNTTGCGKYFGLRLIGTSKNLKR